ncbi:MAG TPA: hypothetical protein GYA10_14620, partial [Alphaproteobacteria bacterium]|nr:hypothetical protein [Alphaproteobacteria bacterium]
MAALLLPLAACSNAPQQPSDVVDDRSAESPDLGGTGGGGVGSPEFTDLAAESSNTADAAGAIPDFSAPDGIATGSDATTTGSLPAEPTDLSSVSG